MEHATKNCSKSYKYEAMLYTLQSKLAAFSKDRVLPIANFHFQKSLSRYLILRILISVPAIMFHLKFLATSTDGLFLSYQEVIRRQVCVPNTVCGDVNMFTTITCHLQFTDSLLDCTKFAVLWIPHLLPYIINCDFARYLYYVLRSYDNISDFLAVCSNNSIVTFNTYITWAPNKGDI